MYMNRVFFAGHLGRDAEAKSTPQGKLVVELAVAVKDGTGDKAETTWMKVVCWEKTGEMVHSAKKGDNVVIEGRLKQRSWDDKQTGAKRSTVEIVAWSAAITQRQGKSDDRPAEQSVPRSQPSPQRYAPQSAPINMDDIPFMRCQDLL